MCPHCDYDRTVWLLLDLSGYAASPNVDAEFTEVVSYALAASLSSTDRTEPHREG